MVLLLCLCDIGLATTVSRDDYVCVSSLFMLLVHAALFDEMFRLMGVFGVSCPVELFIRCGSY